MAQAMLDMRSFNIQKEKTMHYKNTAPSTSSSTSTSCSIDEDDFKSDWSVVSDEEMSRLMAAVPDNSIYIRLSYVDKELINEIKNIYQANIPIIYQPEVISIKLSQEEKIKRKKEYRRAYRKRPDVIQKAERDKLDPEKVKIRKAYASDPQVKARKSLLAKAKRDYIKSLKSDPESDYKKYLSTTVPQLPRKSKKLIKSVDGDTQEKK